MKRLLSLLLILLLLPIGASALPYPEDTVLSVLSLTPEQARLRDFLYTPVFNGETHIDLPAGTRYDDVGPAMNALMQDYPELFHLDRNYSVGYYQLRPDQATYVEPTYRLDAAQAAELRAVLYAQAYLLADADPSPLALHDHLCETVSYGGETELRHTAAGALLEGRATCEGYAQALTLLYRMAGIPCGIIVGTAADSTGQAERHSWNIAHLEDYALIDATWNDQDRLNLNTHWYYGLSAAQMGTDHFPDAGQVIPVCGEQDNWHARRGMVISDRTAADAALSRLISGETVNLRLADGALYRELAKATYDYLGGYNERHPEHAFYGAYSVISSDAQQCVIIERAE